MIFNTNIVKGCYQKRIYTFNYFANNGIKSVPMN